MSESHVRNIPHEPHQQLREQAAAEGRSMSAEAIVVLRQTLQPEGDPSSKHRAAIERLREIRRRTRLPAGTPAAEHFVREDRDLAG